MANRKPLLSLELAAKKGMFKALKASAKVLENRIKENAGETDHSLAQLAKLGHPYSAARPQILHDPNSIVHNQSGNLLDAVETQIVNQYVARVGVNEDKADYVVDVIFGTKYMIARDFITESFHQVEEDMKKAVEEELNRELE